MSLSLLPPLHYLAVLSPHKATRTVEAPRLSEAHRAKIRLVVTGSEDFHGEEVFIDDVITT